MIRTSEPSRSSAASAPSTLVARSYSKGAGVCNLAVPLASGAPDREPLARCPDVVALFVTDGGVGADDRGGREVLRARVTDARVELPCRQAATLDVPENLARRTRGGDRRLAPEPRQRERAPCIDLADPRRVDLRALGKAPQAGGGSPRVHAVDEADGLAQAGLLDEQALEHADARVELLV